MVIGIPYSEECAVSKRDFEKARRNDNSRRGARPGADRTAIHDRDAQFQRFPDKYCKRCGDVLVGGKGGNIQWVKLNGGWKPDLLCKACSILRQ